MDTIDWLRLVSLLCASISGFLLAILKKNEIGLRPVRICLRIVLQVLVLGAVSCVVLLIKEIPAVAISGASAFCALFNALLFGYLGYAVFDVEKFYKKFCSSYGVEVKVLFLLVFVLSVVLFLHLFTNIIEQNFPIDIALSISVLGTLIGSVFIFLGIVIIIVIGSYFIDITGSFRKWFGSKIRAYWSWLIR